MTAKPNLGELANEFLFSGAYGKSLFYSFLAVSQDESDWAVIRLATAASHLLTATESLLILQRYHNAHRGLNYQLALGHALYETGQQEEAARVFLQAIPVSTDDRVNARYILTAAQLFVEQSDPASLNALTSCFGTQIVHEGWCISTILKLVRRHAPKYDEALKPVVLAAFQSDPLPPVEVARKLLLVDLALGFGLVSLEFDDPVMSDLQRLLREYPLQSAKSTSESLLSEEHRLSASKIADLARSALDQGRGFSFIRMGDGEGRFISDLTLFPGLKALSDSAADRIWFWNSDNRPGQQFREALERAYIEADVVGVNPPSRIDLEARNEPLGYLGVALGNEFLVRRRTKVGTCPNSVNAELERSGQLQALVHAAANMGSNVIIITNHVDIQEKAAWLQGLEIEVWAIPSEGHPALKEQSKTRSAHYPDVFHDIVHRLNNRTGALVIVGAGVFGKVYCSIARQANNVAIDVGALLDEWAGFKTR